MILDQAGAELQNSRRDGDARTDECRDEWVFFRERGLL